MTTEAQYRSNVETLLEFLKQTTTDAIVANAILQTIGLTQHQQDLQAASQVKVAPIISATLDQLKLALLQGEPEQQAQALLEWRNAAEQLAHGLKNSYTA